MRRTNGLRPACALPMKNSTNAKNATVPTIVAQRVVLIHSATARTGPVTLSAGVAPPGPSGPAGRARARGRARPGSTRAGPGAAASSALAIDTLPGNSADASGTRGAHVARESSEPAREVSTELGPARAATREFGDG